MSLEVFYYRFFNLRINLTVCFWNEKKSRQMSQMNMLNGIVAFLCLFSILNGVESLNFEFKEHKYQINETESWTGRWFPFKPTEATPTDEHSRIPMGVFNPDCDNAEVHLDVDWLDDLVNFTCFDHISDYRPNLRRRPIYEMEYIPPVYVAAHACMNTSLSYDQLIPTFGTHRPLWPKWGEYTFVPKQRWIHNLEHGGIVMLYHPCANKKEVNKLRLLVKNCLYRHVITPYNQLTPELPLALVAWGSRLQMSAVSKKVVMNFIKDNALRGPEQTARDGQYSYQLTEHSKILSTETDDVLCPNLY